MMLIGFKPQAKKQDVPAAVAGEDIYDVTSADFETLVMKESMTRPVIIDFWAPWCEPCKQLGPVIEAAVTSKKGKVALAKVDIDQNPELAQAFRVQSIPMVVALYQGQPVGAFAGARPKADIDKLVDQLAAIQARTQPEALDIPAVLKDAAIFLSEGDLMQAQQLYAAVLGQEENNLQAYLGIIRVLIAAGELDQAQAMISNAPEPIAKANGFGAAQTALDLVKSAPKDDVATLAEQVKAAPENPDILFNYAEACFAKGLKTEAVDALITLIRSNRTWEDEKARKQLLKYFEAWGFADPDAVAGRKRLSAVLFS
jgi:putative thioredoxin